jgi:vitamin B12 transporter
MLFSHRYFILSLSAGAALCALCAPLHAADSTTVAVLTPEVVVSATRMETATDKVGSAVTVVKSEEIERRGKTSLIDALAGVPGLSFTRTGGVGATTQIKLRGGTSGQTQVLIDGVQLNDGASTDNSFDFDTLTTSGIDRIEVLRGPQSALYGADAMTGVVNIITKRGKGPLKAQAMTEVGSFATRRGAASVSGGGERFGVSVNGSWARSEGFSRVTNTNENDGYNQRSFNGAFSADLTDNWTVDAAGGVFDGRSEYDATGADAYNNAKKTLRYGKLDNTVTLLDGRWENVFTLSTVSTDRSYDEPKGFVPHTNYGSTRNTAEYRGNLKLRTEDVLTVGAARKRESATLVSTYAKSRSTDVDRSITTNSLYGQYLLAATPDLHLTFGGRRDDNSAFGGSNTYRLAGAYKLSDETTLRASYGTGSKAPTLYQLYAPIYGNTALQVEKSVGADVGVEQAFLKGQVVGSATLFWNRFENLINFENSHYVNVGKAHTEGLELAARWAVNDNFGLKGSYTYTIAENDTTDRWLARRPRHMASISADWTPLDGLDLGGSLRAYGKQLDSTFSNRVNNAYIVADFDAAYAVTGNVSVFGRVENLFNADYEDVRGFNTPGRAAFAGVKIKM